MRLWSRLLPGRRKRERGTGGDRIDSRSSSATGEPAGTSSRRANRYENNQRFRPEQIVQPTIEGAGIDSRIRLELDMQERRSRLRMEEMERRSMLRMEEMERRSRLEQDERDRRLRLQMEETERRLKLEMEELDRRLRVRMEEMNQSNVVRERQQYGLTSPNYVSSYNAQPPIIIQQPPPRMHQSAIRKTPKLQNHYAGYPAVTYTINPV
ncbi:hypothetical protein FRC03_000778 [Tulasnella sp. 419]|nr:hypothetical protein FRC03_000778 [Tulasnella sp. 419]